MITKVIVKKINKVVQFNGDICGIKNYDFVISTWQVDVIF